MNKSRFTVVAMACLNLLGLAQPGWAVVNNGFETDYLYVARSSGDNRLARIRLHAERDGSQVADWNPAVDPNYGYWTTLTFAGAGTNDARLFVAQAVLLPAPDNWYGNDVLIAELDANGYTITSKLLSQLIGQSPGAYLDLGNIRYNRYHNTLIVSADPDGNNPSAAATAWEVNLSLSALVHTYVGPASGESRPVNTAFDERTGRLIMGGRNLGNNTDLGNLVAFDTAGRTEGGTTNVYTLLMNGPTRNSTDSAWYKPVAPIYRAGNPNRGDGSDTVLDLTGADANGAPAYEAYLDTVLHPPAADGLIRRPLAFSSYLGYNGQQDEVTGTVWVANFREGLSGLRSNDKTTQLLSGSDWWDVDSPPYFGPVPPIIDPTPNDTAIPNMPYTRQLTLSQGTPPVTWSVITGPTGATVDSTGLVSGWTPTKNDAGTTVTWQVQASNAQTPANTATWQTSVYQASVNGFIPDYVYVIRLNQGPPDATIRTHRKTDGTEITPRWGAAIPGWVTLSFSGTGRNDDVRLFVAALGGTIIDSWFGTDIVLGELDYKAQVVRTKNLSSLVGSAVGSKINLGNIRYNRYHNTLIVSATPDYGTWGPGKAWEVDLELSRLIHTYVGANEAFRPVNTAFDEKTGRLYMSSRNLGEASETGSGDLIYFETAGRTEGGTTYANTTPLIDGPTRRSTDSQWNNPHAPIYRAGSPNRTDGSDTVLCLTGGASGTPACEAWLDIALHPLAEDGYLSRRPLGFTNSKGYNGQQDEVSGDVWVANALGKFSVLKSDDSVGTFGSVVVNNNWQDIDTPPYQPCNAPAADLDGDTDVDQADFAVFQAECFGQVAPFEGTLPQTCACVDLGDDNDDGVPDYNGTINGFDYAAFEDCASGPGIPAVPTCGG